ncbi:hypothetical protein Glove_258g48 [Diversispora epigaea]|uniref:Uncharacterized protein n=1 Tax=Diversispora epigaea TaxID=1348612 RepID=A0A397I6T5_9GLOM|nr:hypothetical protein Glove_258g48 [Diversispora epigaea]
MRFSTKVFLLQFESSHLGLSKDGSSVVCELESALTQQSNDTKNVKTFEFGTNANEATHHVFIISIEVTRRGQEKSRGMNYPFEGKPRNVEIGYLQNIMQLESAYGTVLHHVPVKANIKSISKMALKEDLDSIRESVKRVLGVIVRLLKDRFSGPMGLKIRKNLAEQIEGRNKA